MKFLSSFSKLLLVPLIIRAADTENEPPVEDYSKINQTLRELQKDKKLNVKELEALVKKLGESIQSDAVVTKEVIDSKIKGLVSDIAKKIYDSLVQMKFFTDEKEQDAINMLKDPDSFLKTKQSLEKMFQDGERDLKCLYTELVEIYDPKKAKEMSKEIEFISKNFTKKDAEEKTLSERLMSGNFTFDNFKEKSLISFIEDFETLLGDKLKDFKEEEKKDDDHDPEAKYYYMFLSLSVFMGLLAIYLSFIILRQNVGTRK